MLTGIYGGSFNPIHTGHTRLAQWLVDEGVVGEMWLLVTPQNPFKATEGLMPDDLRLRLARIAVQPLRHVCASDFEFRLPRPSYMVHTLAALRAAYPERNFALVIGADNWQRFPQWYRADEILAHHPVIIYPRPRCHIDAAALPSGVTLTQAPLFDISSTEIREAMTRDPSYDGQGLDPAVWHVLKAMTRDL